MSWSTRPLVRAVRSACCAAIAVQGLLHGAPVHAAAAEVPWEFAVTPYVWIPYVGSSLSFQTPGNGGSTLEMSDYLKNLNAAAFVSGEARHGVWALSLDVVYCNFKSEKSNVTSITSPGGEVDVPVNSDTRTGLTGSMFSLTGSRTVLRAPQATLDVLGGLRYTHIGATLDWAFEAPVNNLPSASGAASRSVDLWDGVVGVRGQVRFGGGKWFMPYYLDAGAGSSKFTWQTMAGVGYSFGWGDLLLAYRYLSFEQSGGDQLIQHFYLYGPALGATFRF